MPITGLTDVPKAFLKIGQIRKGQKDPQTGAPIDLDYFRVTFYPNETECEALFREVYGEQPRMINIRLAFPNASEVWDANFECYSKGGMIAKAYSYQDPVTLQEMVKWIFYRDHKTGDVLVRNGSPVGEEGARFIAQPIDLSRPIYSYSNRKGEKVDVPLEPVGRLQVVIPELAQLRVGYMEFRATSTKDIMAISRELAAIDHMAKQAGKDITGIPMKLTRREEEITKNIGGNLSRGPSWLVHIEVGGEWGGKALEYIERKALPEWIDAEVEETAPVEDEIYGNGWDADLARTEQATPPIEQKSTTLPRESAEPGCTPQFLVNENLYDNVKHAAAVMQLLGITDGAPAEASLKRVKLYLAWRKVEGFSRNDPATREKAAAKAIAGEVVPA